MIERGGCEGAESARHSAATAISMMTRGKFISVEGGEGAGKTSALQFARAYLEEAGTSVRLTREPGGTPLGEALRAVLLDSRYAGMSRDAELLLMFAARAEHVATVIRPGIEAGNWVLCDRFTDATYAYQGGGRGIDAARIRQLERWVQGDIRPDVVLLLDVPVATGMQRAAGRGVVDRFESEQLDFFGRVRAVYLERARRDRDRYRLIDARGSIEAVHDQIRAVLDELLARVG
jgi:dTMP kinase